MLGDTARDHRWVCPRCGAVLSSDEVLGPDTLALDEEDEPREPAHLCPVCGGRLRFRRSPRVKAPAEG